MASVRDRAGSVRGSSRGGGGGSRASLDAATKDQGFFGNLGSDIADLFHTAPRAAIEMAKAPITDIGQVPVNLASEAAGGDPDWQLDTWSKVIEPWVTESIPSTLDVAFGAPWEVAKGIGRGEPIEGAKAAQEEAKGHAQDFYERPASFTLEHLGNVSIAGSVASRPLGAAASKLSGRAGTSAGLSATKKAARATRKADRRAGQRPTTSPRRARQEALAEIASEGGTAGRLAKGSLVSQNIVGHPYQAALSKAVNARVPGLGGRATAGETPEGAIAARGGNTAPGAGALAGMAAGSLADLGLTGGLAGATIGTLASARRAGAQSQSLGSLTRQVARPRTAPEAGEFSPTAQSIRSNAQAFADSPLGQRLGQSRLSQTGRGVRKAASRTKKATDEARSSIRERFDSAKAEQRIARGINQHRNQLREAGVDLPAEPRVGGIQRRLETDPAEMGRVMDDIERVNRQRREAGQEPIDVPGSRDLDWALTRVREAERAGDFAEGELQRLVTRKAQLGDLAEPHGEAQRLAREYGEQQGMTPDEVNRTLRQSMSTETMLPDEAATYRQLDPEARRAVDNAAETWRGWQRHQETRLAQEGLLDPKGLAVQASERKPTTRVVREGEGGEIRFDMDPDQLELQGGGLPPTPEGHTRVWRGMSDQDVPAEELAHLDASAPGELERRGQMFYRSREQAEAHADSLRQQGIEDADVRYVDVPDEELQTGGDDLLATLRDVSGAPGEGEVRLTPERAAQARRANVATQIDRVPQYVADQHRRVQRLRREGADEQTLQRAQRDLSEAEERWAKEQPTNVTFEPIPTDEPPPAVNVPPGGQARAALQRRGLLVERLEGETSKRREAIRESRVAHQAEAMDRYNELHAEVRRREKEALNKDPATAEGQQAWDQYARAYEQLDAFENELVLASVGGRPKPMRNTAEAIQNKLEGILRYARNTEDFVPGSDELAALNEALGELEKVHATLPEVGPILALIGREGIGGGSPELRSLHRAAEANPRLAETPEFQQALSYASRRTSRRGYEQIEGSGRQQHWLRRGQRAQRQGREALEGGFAIEREVAELGQLVSRYKEQARPFEQKLAKTQSKARAQLQDLAKHEQRLERARRKYDEFRENINHRLEATPEHYRPALRFARDEAPELDRMLREDFEVPHEIVDDLELENLPQTLQELHDAGVNPTYVHTMEAEGLGRTAHSGRSPELGETEAKRFKRARHSGNVFAEDQPGVLIPASQMQMVQQMLHNDMVKFVERKFSKRPRQVMEDAGYSRGRIDEIMEEARGHTTYDEDTGELIEHRKPQPHVLEHEMKKLGFANLQTNQALQPLRRYGTEAPEGLWMPENMGKIAADALTSGNLEKSLRTFFDPLMGVWKASVLALRPAWQVYNMAGGAIMSIVGGGATPAEMVRYLPDAVRARRRFGRGDPSGVPGMNRQVSAELFDTTTSTGAYRRDIRAAEEGFGRQGEGLRGAVGQLPSMQNLSQSKIAQSLPGRMVKGATSRVGGRAGRIVEGSFRLNSFFDHVFRSTVYLSQLERGANPAAAVRMAKKTLGDYTTMSPFERQVIRRSFPFYAWTRHISQLTLRQLAPGNINRFSMMASVMQTVGEPNKWEEMLPAYAAGDIHVGTSEEGEPIFLGMGGINPFTDVTAPIIFGGGFSFRGLTKQLNPLASAGLSRLTGIEPLTMQPYSRPYPEVDEQGRAIPTAPPFHQQLIDMVPQARYAQQIGRRVSGETLARYGSDDPVLIPGSDDRSVLGEGAQLLGASVRPMDVQGMKARRDERWERALRQRQQYQAELEQYRNSERSQSPLRDLPFIP